MNDCFHKASVSLMLNMVMYRIFMISNNNDASNACGATRCGMSKGRYPMRIEDMFS